MELRRSSQEDEISQHHYTKHLERTSPPWPPLAHLYTVLLHPVHTTSHKDTIRVIQTVIRNPGRVSWREPLEAVCWACLGGPGPSHLLRRAGAPCRTVASSRWRTSGLPCLQHRYRLCGYVESHNKIDCQIHNMTIWTNFFLY